MCVIFKSKKCIYYFLIWKNNKDEDSNMDNKDNIDTSNLNKVNRTSIDNNNINKDNKNIGNNNIDNNSKNINNNNWDKDNKKVDISNSQTISNTNRTNTSNG